MNIQNWLADLLCRFGGDRYTREGTWAALQQTLQQTQLNPVPLDVQNDRWILFSDLHKGAKNGADDFRRCETIYVRALDYYFKEGYNLCVMGDAEELWEEFPRIVLRKNTASFAAEKRFHDEGRYLRLWGNHDEIWGDPRIVRRLLQRRYGKQPLAVPEALLFNATDGKTTLGQILLIHGHQGTQNSGQDNRLAKWTLHNIWRPLQILTGVSCNTPATDWKIRQDRDKIIYEWAAQQPQLMLITGHTHAPVFESYSHRARLLDEIARARENMKTAVGDQQAVEHHIEKLIADLRAIEDQLSAEEVEASVPLKDPLPCYFNTGCCCFADGDITGIEISAGEIRLVRWPDDNDQPRGKVLQTGSLREIFQTIQH